MFLAVNFWGKCRSAASMGEPPLNKTPSRTWKEDKGGQGAVLGFGG